MSKRIFLDADHQAIFDKQGFIVLPFLNQEEVNELDLLFDKLHPNVSTSGFFSGTYSSDNAYKENASKEIVRIFDRAYKSIFTNYTPFGGTFLYKVPGENSSLAVHQDWTIVDEAKNVAVNCWVPLCDVTLENGPIMVLPGSQYDVFEVIRAPTLPFFFTGGDDMVMNELIPIEVKAGTAVLLNQSVIHYSPPNNSKKIRKAITAGVKSAGAQMYFHYKIPDKDELEIFRVKDSFFLQFKDFINDIGKRPYWGESIGIVPYKLPQLSGEKLYDLLKQMKMAAGYEMKTIYSNISEINNTVSQENIKTNMKWWKRFF